jgi:hypothetical protein
VKFDMNKRIAEMEKTMMGGDPESTVKEELIFK